MPFSTPIFKAETLDFIKSRFPRNAEIIDVGVGAGTYADRLRAEGYINIDGIEAWEPYVEAYGLRYKYNYLFITDACGFLPYADYDLAIVGDVLEHIEAELGQLLINRLLKECKDVIVCVPFMSEQGVHFDNDYEIHKQSDLNEDVMAERYPGLRPLCLRYDYGVYVRKETEVDVIYDELYYGDKNRYKKDYVAPQKTDDAGDPDITIVSGLWNIGRQGRSFDVYISMFKEFLQIDCRMVLFVPQELEAMVWQHRSRENTYVKIYELLDIRSLYAPHWDRTQAIRVDETWRQRAPDWLPGSPQASLEWYNPIVQSKMFMLHEASIWSPFNTGKLVWMDAGISKTINIHDLKPKSTWFRIADLIEPWLFVSYPYEADKEIHGFEIGGMNKYAGADVKYVCRGGLFGGTKTAIRAANSSYYSLLQNTLSEGFMGTEESLFTIMSYNLPDVYRRFELVAEDHGIMQRFVSAAIAGTAVLTAGDPRVWVLQQPWDSKRSRTDLYFLTFNFPDQLEATAQTYKAAGWLDKAGKVWVVDNSVSDEARQQYAELCRRWGFEYMPTGSNLGINPGRQKVAEHFNTTEADYYIFFEDDMTIGGPGDSLETCRRGFRRYVPDLWDVIHKTMVKDELDFLKLSFTEVYMDNYLQVSWFNVPESRRQELWPHFWKRRNDGQDYQDIRFPRTRIDKIDEVGSTCYAVGDIYYCNWPTIMSKTGNKKVFLEVINNSSGAIEPGSFQTPYEQTWMSHVYERQLRGDIKAGVLLASPVIHDRFRHYSREERREN